MAGGVNLSARSGTASTTSPRRRLLRFAAPAAVLGIATLLFLTAGATVALTPPPASSPPAVLAIHPSPYTIEQGTFTVGVKVSDPSAVTFAYFLFCQLSSPLCYLPVAMKQNSTNWFSGTTNLMSSYHGMTEGVEAGYNITIEYANNTNLTEPSFPNAFPSLNISKEVGGGYMFRMSVGPNLYNVSGTVKDAVTGSAIAGASVTVTPGDNSTITDAAGAFTVSGLTNGTYSLSIAHSGYATTTQTVSISGSDQVQNVPLSSGSGTPPPAKPSNSNSPLASPVVWAGIAVAVVVVALLIVLLRRRGGNPPGPTSPVAAPANEPPS